MAAPNHQSLIRAMHPIYAVLLAGTIPLYLGGLLSDIAYARSYEIQWTNFASWLVAGGNLFAGLALLWALINLIRGGYRSSVTMVFTALLLGAFVIGFFNSLIHAKDAWASMPTGLYLSVIVALLACVATGIGFFKFGVGGER